MTKKPDERESLSLEFKGVQYTGSYTISSGMVHVSSLYGRKSTQIGGYPGHLLAQRLFKEIITEADAAGTLD